MLLSIWRRSSRDTSQYLVIAFGIKDINTINNASYRFLWFITYFRHRRNGFRILCTKKWLVIKNVFLRLIIDPCSWRGRLLLFNTEMIYPYRRNIFKYRDRIDDVVSRLIDKLMPTLLRSCVVLPKPYFGDSITIKIWYI